MRVLSFQSQSVLDILKSTGEYKIDKQLCREKHSYNKELEAYGYESPVWVFAPIGMARLITPNVFHYRDFIDASKFMNFKCEMSLRNTTDLNNFLLLELDVEESQLKDGITHNGCSYAKVVNGITLDQLRAVYRLEYNRAEEAGWYYPTVHIVELFDANPLFPKSFKCHDTSDIRKSNSF